MTRTDPIYICDWCETEFRFDGETCNTQPPLYNIGGANNAKHICEPCIELSRSLVYSYRRFKRR